MPVVYPQPRDPYAEQLWVASRPGIVLLTCGCFWDELSGDFMVVAECGHHRKDLERHGIHKILPQKGGAQ
jgi:hypothetical protein